MPYSTTPTISLTLTSEDFKNNVVYGPNNDVPLLDRDTENQTLGHGQLQSYSHVQALCERRRDLVAEIQFHRISPPTISYQGVTRDLTDMFPKKGWLSSSRLMPSPVGECKWSSNRSVPELYDPSGRPYNVLLVKFSLPSANRHLPRCKSRPEAMAFSDLIIMGWIITMRDIEHKHV